MFVLNTAQCLFARNIFLILFDIRRNNCVMLHLVRIIFASIAGLILSHILDKGGL